MRIVLSAKEKINLLADLSTMLQAGISILEAVDLLLEDSRSGARKLLTITKQELNEGKQLSEAFEKAPDVFDPVTLNLIHAAEEAGTLETTLRDIVAAGKKDLEFNDQLKASMAYPLFVMVVFTGVLGLMLVFVIPRIGKVFSSLRVEVPASTELLIKSSEIFLANWPQIIGALAIGSLLLAVLYQFKKRAFIRLLLSLPFLAKLGYQIDLTRFTRSMGLLLHAGLPITEALNLSERVVQKKQTAALIARMEQLVSNGKPLSAAFDKRTRHIIPSMMQRVIETAETTGTIDKSMQDLSAYFANQVSRTLKTIATLMEPILLVVVGVLVGGMMVSIIAPIYNIITQIQPG